MNEDIYDYLNEYKEKIQHIGDIILNLDYWDCECDENFIHPISLLKCGLCKYEQEDCPSSRENEVQYFIHKKKIDGFLSQVTWII